MAKVLGINDSSFPDMNEQSRNIVSTKRKINDLEAQICETRRKIEILNQALLVDQKYNTPSSLPVNQSNN